MAAAHSERGYVLVPGDLPEPGSMLPEGVVRLSESVIAAERLLPNPADDGGAAEDGVTEIAVFDFDGTIISGNSPVLLVRYLTFRKMLRVGAVACTMAWGAAYKLRLPQNEIWVRSKVFSAFRGKPVAWVNAYLHRFFDEVVAERFREPVEAIMREHCEAGHAVVCVSATFEPILAKAMASHPIQYGIATRMAIDAFGCYTDQVDGLPVEGEEKVAALTAFADERFGAGKWKLRWAYGDHHSDRALLAAAENAYAVTPDRPLARTARERGYEVIDL